MPECCVLEGFCAIQCYTLWSRECQICQNAVFFKVSEHLGVPDMPGCCVFEGFWDIQCYTLWHLGGSISYVVAIPSKEGISYVGVVYHM